MYFHGSHDFTTIIHLCVISCSLILGTFLRAKISLLRKYLIPAPMIGGFFLLLFYNYAAPALNLSSGKVFLEELVFHLLNISFISMQLRIPEQKTRHQKKIILLQNLTALIAEYGLQCFFGLLAAVVLLKNFLPGSAAAIGLTLALGFELGPGQAESMAKVWEASPYNVSHAGDVGLTMAAIGFIVGSVVGVIFINRAAKKGWINADYVEKLRNRKMGNGFFKNRSEQLVGSFQTTASESMDSFSLHLAIVLFTYLLSFLFLAGVEKLGAVLIGGKILEAIQGLWGINFVFSSVFAILVRRAIIKLNYEYIIDNHTYNRIDGIAVDFTIAACLGAIKITAIRSYIVPILVLTAIGIIITCFITPYFCSRLFSNYSFFRFLMIFGTANGTLPTALSLVRVVDPDFETPVAQDYVNSTGLMFVLALPIIALVNWPAKGRVVGMLIVTGAYIVIAFLLYLFLSRGKAFAGDGYFYTVRRKRAK